MNLDMIKIAAFKDELQKIAGVELINGETSKQEKERRAVAGTTGLASGYGTLLAPFFLGGKYRNQESFNSKGLNEKINPLFHYIGNREDMEDPFLNKIRQDQITDEMKEQIERQGKTEHLNKNFSKYIKSLEKTPFGQDIKPTVGEKVISKVKIPGNYLKKQYFDVMTHPLGTKHFGSSIAVGLIAGNLYNAMAKKRNIEKNQKAGLV